MKHFSDYRDDYSLNRDLVMIKQTPKETPLQFLNRVLEILSTPYNYINVHERLEQVKRVKLETFKNTALKTFLSGLRNSLGRTVRPMRPTSLSIAKRFFMEEMNIQYLSSNNYDYSNIQQRPNTFFQNNKRQFPSEPIQIKHLNYIPPKLITNSHVFGNSSKNQNVHQHQKRTLHIFKNRLL